MCALGMRQLKIYTLLLFAVVLLLFELYSHSHPSVNRTMSLHQQEILNSEEIERDTHPEYINSLNAAETVISDVVDKYTASNDTVRKSNPKAKPLKQISVDFIGRLGNLMFEYASLVGIAYRNNLKPVVPRSLDILKYFDLHVAIHPNFRMLRSSSKQFNEKRGCTYEPEVMNLGSGRDFILSGYFQSWKYFNFVDKEIRANFRWKDDIAGEARRQFHEIIHSSHPRQHYIGVHVRRGDMVHSATMTNYGYISADRNYLEKAMNHFRTKLRNVLFIVVSDDTEWCLHNIPGDDVRFVQKNNSAPVDMAILTMCNHSVMTTGSFGWWSAWLAGGDVVYYSGYPRPNSSLFHLFTSEDYRPPSWIGM